MSESGDSPSPRKRRRLLDSDDEEEDDSLFDNQEDRPSSSSSSRRQLMEKLAAERRRQKRASELKKEVAELQAEEFTPVDPADVASPHASDNEDVDDEVDQDYDYAAPQQQDEEEEEDGEDLMENAERDYQRIDALDHYGTEGIDDRNYDLMDMEQRRAAEKELEIRDRQVGRAGRSAGLYSAALDVGETEEDEEARRARRGLFRSDRDGGGDDDGDDDGDDETDEEDLDGEDPINIEAFDVPLREWIAQERTRREIQRRFRAFLRHFVEGASGERRRRGNGMYEQKIRQMCAANQATLQVSFLHFMESEAIMAYWIVDAPKDMFEVLDEAATRHTLRLFPSYDAIQKEIHVRISHVPIMDSLRDLRMSHLERLVKVHGVVTRRSNVYPQLQEAVYKCLNCKATQGPFRVESTGSMVEESYRPEECPMCDAAGRFQLDTPKCVYRNYQRVNLQETPGSVPPGRVPRTKEVILTNDLIDIARPGEEIEITGVYEQSYDASLTLKSGFPVFNTFLTANHVSKREDASSTSNLSEQDVRDILDLAKDNRIGDRIVKSMAPSIFGHEHCKMALAMSLFGGNPKNISDKHRIRGDINVLLLGDPGTAKSQLLKYAEITAPRAVYSTGKGASAVGLTAGVHKDPITKEWTLEGGALVLADKGVALIDEFDKSK